MAVTAPESKDRLRNVQQISGTAHAFAAIVAHGSVVSWGDMGDGGDRVQDLFGYI